MVAEPMWFFSLRKMLLFDYNSNFRDFRLSCSVTKSVNSHKMATIGFITKGWYLAKAKILR